MKQFLAALCLLVGGSVHAASYPGQVIRWGLDPDRQYLTDPLYYNSTGNVAIAGQRLSNAVAIAASRLHGLALKDDGTVAGWGFNAYGQVLGSPFPATAPLVNTSGPVTIDGKILRDVAAIAAGDNLSMALRHDGSVFGWGENKVPVGLSNIVAIAAGGMTCLALKQDGSVVGWENVPRTESYGQLFGVEGLSNVVAIAAGSMPGGGSPRTRNIALKKDGMVFTWVHQSINQEPPPPAGLSNVIAVAAGISHSLALTRDGTVTGWGYNNEGQAIGTPTPSEPHMTNGLVRINGQILSNVVAVAAYYNFSMALKADGTVVGWGKSYRGTPVGLTGVTAIAAGESFCLAITTNRVVADRFQQPK